ncbi:uncharacterized protein CELE_Y46G5A.14 [Caenorhabditis elegans]|uniref:Uncharacterized protein n=1 Tax=Caenorhabditis elegans TaxID=6239 RepID=Q9U2F4_CAEEL|nr:Uncharacterized protein CELE_Y46G5A.14 [Caenorhabditis elegans]CAB60357.1 Uncharacterized protein CELE_Y46G5A.14 [Caenorhabditis elegans]|eukprot:NP_496719.1 Uncharacterized protein CELE_Y46G5A.14 [Caenorhabditis elegans]
MLIELLISITVLASILVSCKKEKNEAAKLKPRGFDRKSSGAPAPAGANLVNKSGGSGGGSGGSGDANRLLKREIKEVKMEERSADDNETINDVKSNWGTV